MHSVTESEEEWQQQTSTRKQLVRAHRDLYHDRHMLAALQNEQNACHATDQSPETSRPPATLQTSTSEISSNAVPETDDHMYENWMIINRQSEMEVGNLIITICFVQRVVFVLDKND